MRQPGVNEYGEQLIFWQRRGWPYAVLLHSDLGWDPVKISPSGLLIPGGAPLGLEFGGDFPEELRRFMPVPTVSGIILNMPEALWLASCFVTTGWMRQEVEAEAGSATDAYTDASDFLASSKPRR